MAEPKLHNILRNSLLQRGKLYQVCDRAWLFAAHTGTIDDLMTIIPGNSIILFLEGLDDPDLNFHWKKIIYKDMIGWIGTVLGEIVREKE